MSEDGWQSLPDLFSADLDAEVWDERGYPRPFNAWEWYMQPE